MRRYIADLHFDHESMNTRMDHRGFPSVEEMNEYMIRQWNGTVKRNDEVVILGDFIWSGDPRRAKELLLRLKGKKIMILGNHDRAIRNKEFDRTLFRDIVDYKEMSDNGRRVILCHYPILYYNHQYHTKDGNPKTYMLCGHIHDTLDSRSLDRHILEDRKRTVLRSDENGTEQEFHIPCNIINAFCMYSDYVPLTLDEWIRLTEKRLVIIS